MLSSPINLPHVIVVGEREFRDLVAGKAISYTLGGVKVEIALNDNFGWKQMAGAVLDAIDAQLRPRDPPEATEFLSRRTRRRRPGK